MKIRYLFIGLFIFFTTITILLGFYYISFLDRLEHASDERSRIKTKEVVNRINSEFQQIEAFADSLAQVLSTNELSEQSRRNIFTASINSHRDIFGVGFFNISSEELIHEYHYKRGDSIVTNGDHTAKDFLKRASEQGLWTDEIFYGEKTKTLKLQLVKKLNDAGDHLYLHVSFKEIEKLISRIDFGKAGYGFIISPSGKFIYHPTDRWVLRGRTIFDSGYSIDSLALSRAISEATREELSLLKFKNTINNTPSMYYFGKLEVSSWIAGVMFFQDELIDNTAKLRQLNILFITALILSIIFLVNCFSSFSYWPRSIASSILFIFGIGYIWSLSFDTPVLDEYDASSEDILITEKVVLDNFIDKTDSLRSKKGRSFGYRYIPTGIHLEHIQLMEAHTFMVSGYVWQKIQNSDTLTQPGIIFPEAEPNPEFMEIEEAYVVNEADYTTYGYYFRASIRKKLNYEDYPLDWQNIRIKIWPEDITQNVMLVPDLDAYQITNPRSLPGVQKSIVLPAWKAYESFFSYRPNKYNSNFGSPSNRSFNDYYELSYNVYIKRVFLSPFVANFIPIFVVLILLFTVVVSDSRSEDYAEVGKTDKKTRWGVLELSAAFFFVLMLAHTSLRGQLDIQQLIYVEYYYFAVYAMIIVICAIATLYKNQPQSDSLWQNKRRLLPLLYWPLISCFLFIITVVVFYF
ncbi:MAG: hypothetical protein LAT68_00990 [Cyclobacteriaceae bacterium]|nr:hypothetical protein [Cyclobacteriaceae bacterium]MCH8514878.1 hypothetical protein [Cyclobacteriaceae bacterium]